MNNIIEKYMRNITINDVNNFAYKKKVNLSDEELRFTYTFIKQNWEEIIKNPALLNIEQYKDKYSAENFIKIKDLINEYSKKYQSYL